MRARVEEARAGGDVMALREAATALARWLASRDRDLDEAVDLASQALHIAEDLELRREVAAWLESLGETARAAVLLRPIASQPDVEFGEAAYVLIRTGVLKARAGAAAGAVAAFEAAVSIDPEDALPAELLGAVAAWDAEALAASEAAEAYVEAARRRAAQDQGEAELEDLWRAVAIRARERARWRGARAGPGASAARGRSGRDQTCPRACPLLGRPGGRSARESPKAKRCHRRSGPGACAGGGARCGPRRPPGRGRGRALRHAPARPGNARGAGGTSRRAGRPRGLPGAAGAPLRRAVASVRGPACR